MLQQPYTAKSPIMRIDDPWQAIEGTNEGDYAIEEPMIGYGQQNKESRMEKFDPP